jgi:TM2 domain-containing membrane protein YozV
MSDPNNPYQQPGQTPPPGAPGPYGAPPGAGQPGYGYPGPPQGGPGGTPPPGYPQPGGPGGTPPPGYPQQAPPQYPGAPGPGMAPPAGGPQYGSDPNAPYGYDPYGRPYSHKSKMVAGILQILVGGVGAGRWYTGHTGMAVAQLLTCGGMGIWSLIDGILFLTKDDRTDAQGRPLRSGS